MCRLHHVPAFCCRHLEASVQPYRQRHHGSLSRGEELRAAAERCMQACAWGWAELQHRRRGTACRQCSPAVPARLLHTGFPHPCHPAQGIWGSDDWMEMWERGSQGRHGAEGEATSGALPWRHGDSRAEKPCGGGRCSGRASEQWHVLAGAGAGAQQQQQQQRQWSGAEEEEEEDDEQQQRQGQRQQGHVEVEEMRVQQVHTTSSSLVADESTLILRVKRMGSVTKPDQQLKGHTAMQAMLANLRTNDRGLRRRQH